MEKVQLFSAFYEENKDKIIMPVSETYPINYDNMMQWLQALSDNDQYVQMLGHIVSNALKHIGFQQFFSTLQSNAVELVTKASIVGKPIVVILDDVYVKSNTWVLLLVWPILKNSAVDIIHNLSRSYIERVTKKYPQGVVFAHVDDGAFSGSQIATALDAESMTLILNFYEQHVYYVLVASLSDIARAHILQKSPIVQFPTQTIQFKSLGDWADHLLGPKQAEQFLMAMQSEKYRDLYQVYRSLHLIYFDYKLPDGVSTIQKLIALAPDLNPNTGGISLRSLITNCDVADYTFDEGKSAAQNPSEFFSDFDDTGTCPVAFYKRINYTVNGKPLAQLAPKPRPLFDYVMLCTNCFSFVWTPKK